MTYKGENPTWYLWLHPWSFAVSNREYLGYITRSGLNCQGLKGGHTVLWMTSMSMVLTSHRMEPRLESPIATTILKPDWKDSRGRRHSLNQRGYGSLSHFFTKELRESAGTFRFFIFDIEERRQNPSKVSTMALQSRQRLS